MYARPPPFGHQHYGAPQFQQPQYPHSPHQYHHPQWPTGAPSFPTHEPMPNDDPELRRKHEQRRKQQEYAQALAEQVRLRQEQQNQHRPQRYPAHDADIHHAQAHAPVTDGRGLFDGLGNNDSHRQRANFARGRRDVPAHAHAHAPPPPPQAAWSAQPQPQMQAHVQGPLGQYYPQPMPQSFHHQDVAQHRNDEYLDMTPAPEPHGHFQAHAPNLMHDAAAPPAPRPGSSAVANHRTRTDLHNGGGSDALDAKRRQQQQQQAMQDALRRQIEEKNRQKQEEKRRRDEEERREMEKFERERQRQQEEEARQKEERRRKALADEQQQRTQHEKIQAAAAAAMDEQRQQHLLRRQQHNHNQPHHEEAPSRVDPRANHPHEAPQSQSTVGAAGFHPSGRDRNPFTNSRAHLFEDPPQVSSHNDAFTAHHQHHHQTASPQQASSPHWQRQQRQEQPPQADVLALQRQYEDMRAELQHQRQLVEQLYVQLQQRPAVEPPPGSVPTLSDLERLRNDLREELEQRELQHREEIERLKHQHARVLECPRDEAMESHRVRHSGELPAKTSTVAPTQSEPRRYRKPQRREPFVQVAIEEEDDDEEDAPEEPTLDSRSKPQLSVRPERNGREQRSGRRSNQASSPLRPEIQQRPHTSLQCESHLVFFDGQVQPDGAANQTDDSTLPVQHHQRVKPSTRIVDSAVAQSRDGKTTAADSVDALIERLHHRYSVPSSATMVWSTNQQQEHERSRDAPAPAPAIEPNEDLEDSLEFFVKTMDPRFGSGPPHRYKEHTTPIMNVARTSGSRSTSLDHHDALELVEVGNEHTDDADELGDEDSSLTGDELETIFLRNLKRHEILSAFQRSGTKTPDAPGTHTQPLSSTRWQQLQRLLENVPADVQAQRHAGRPHLDEPSLVASSRWLPSSAM